MSLYILSDCQYKRERLILGNVFEAASHDLIHNFTALLVLLHNSLRFLIKIGGFISTYFLQFLGTCHP